MTVAVPDQPKLLTPRWHPHRYHAEQHRLETSSARFRVVAAGGQSGKTEWAKREGVLRWLECPLVDGRIVFCAPTRDQAKRIYWEDLKALVPPRIVQGRPSETELTIKGVHGPSIMVVGMDKPHRLEGISIYWFCLDEFGDMKPNVFGKTIRPAISTPGKPPGEGAFIGRPRGRNHFYRLYEDARRTDRPEWDSFHWRSAEIMTEEEIEAIRREVDPLTYRQEFEAEFVTFEGRAYYAFDREVHARERVKYHKDLDLIVAFDFNRAPGVACYLQEQEYKGDQRNIAKTVTAAIGEVWIPANSNTRIVCRRIIKDYGSHERSIICYGDATGGAKGSAKVEGSDWDIIEKELRPVFGGRLKFRVPGANPPERVRINAVNSRLETADGVIHALFDPVNCPHLIEDMDGVITIEGGSGEIDKDYDKMLTHLSDAYGYYCAERWPIHEVRSEMVAIA